MCTIPPLSNELAKYLLEVLKKPGRLNTHYYTKAGKPSIKLPFLTACLTLVVLLITYSQLLLNYNLPVAVKYVTNCTLLQLVIIIMIKLKI